MSIGILKRIDLRNVRLAEFNGLKSFWHSTDIDGMIFREADIEEVVEESIWPYDSNRADR